MGEVEHRIRALDSGAAPFSRLVVLDGATLDPGDNPFDGLARFGAVEVHPRTAPELLLERARGAEVLLTNKCPLDAEAFAALPGLRLVAVTATGVNIVDLEAAARHGVRVCNAPAYSGMSVAQHVFALLLEATNAVAVHDAAVREGQWAASLDFSLGKAPLTELAGRTMGIVGHGAIGSAVGRLAHAFGMKVLAFSPGRRVGAAYEDFAWATVGELFANSDVVSLHCPLTPDNRGFVDAALLATMRDGSLLVNTARGDLVDEVALAEALDRGRPARALLDVLSVEPPSAGHPLTRHPRAIVTPHVAWATLAARRRLMDITIANVAAFAAGRPQNVVA